MTTARIAGIVAGDIGAYARVAAIYATTTPPAAAGDTRARIAAVYATSHALAGLTLGPDRTIEPGHPHRIDAPVDGAEYTRNWTIGGLDDSYAETGAGWLEITPPARLAPYDIGVQLDVVESATGIESTARTVLHVPATQEWIRRDGAWTPGRTQIVIDGTPN